MKRDYFKIRFTGAFILTLTLVFYQLFLPLTLVKANADEGSSEATNASEDENSNTNNNANSNDNAGSKETCEVKNSELTDYCQEKLDCDDIDKCLVKNSCSEIKSCLKVEIENKNESEVNNNVNADSNTGKNEVKQDNDNDNEEILNQVQDENSNSNANENCNANSNANENVNANENGNVNGNENENENSSENDNSSPNQDADIDTGDAAAGSDVYNEVNTNVVSNNYQETVINIEGTSDEDVNLLDQFQTLLEQDRAENPPGSLVVSNENEADVTNDINVTANSGENTIETEGVGDTSAAIQTGDATALSNAVNVVNTNIVGNNVLFAVVNVYGEWNGDLIVPGEGLLEVTPEPTYSETVIVNENEAEVENNTVVEANTGENSISQEGDGNSAAVITGAAYAGSEVLNVVSTNIVQNNFFFLLVNNLGSWTGKILNWNEESEEYTNIFSYDFGVLGDGETPTIDGILAIFNKNTATVTNNVNVSANTGGNEITAEGNNNQALIETGNALAMAKIVNFINTNIIGNNWIFAIVNIMGQWNGDMVFAYPDLSVGISDGRDQVGSGESVNYQITYKNNGKAASENANILISLPSFVSSQDSLNYSLPGLKPGEEKTFSVSGVVSSEIPEGNTNLEALVGINTGTKEVELSNNMGKDDTTAYRPTFVAAAVNDGSLLVNAGDQNSAPKMTINRDVKDSKVHAGDTVIYNIYIENTGGMDLHNVVVFDEMKLGKATMATFSWNVGDIKQGRKYRIQYKLAINKLAPAGVYRSTASGFGYDPSGNEVEANEDSQKVTILGNNVDSMAYTQEYYNNGNFFQYGDSIIAGGICFLDEWPVLNQAQAAENPTFLAGAQNDPYLPLWMWLAAAAAYFLAINWSFFPKRRLGGLLANEGAITEMMPAEVEEENFDYLE